MSKVEAVRVYPGGRRELRMTEPENVVSAARAKDQLNKGHVVYVTLADLRQLDRVWQPSKKEAGSGN